MGRVVVACVCCMRRRCVRTVMTVVQMGALLSPSISFTKSHGTIFLCLAFRRVVPVLRRRWLDVDTRRGPHSRLLRHGPLLHRPHARVCCCRRHSFGRKRPCSVRVVRQGPPNAVRSASSCQLKINTSNRPIPVRSSQHVGQSEGPRRGGHARCAMLFLGRPLSK